MPVGEYAAKSSGRSVGKTLLVLRHELITTVTKPMFVLTCVGIPLLILLQMAAMDAMSPRPFLGSRSGAVSAGDDTLATPELEVQGYVDQSGLIQTIPANIPPGMLVAYADEASARHALEAGKIAAFYVIPAEYVETGELVTIRPDFSPLSLNDQSSLMNWTLLASLFGGDIELAAQVWNPMELQESVWTPASDTRAADEGPSRMDEQDRLMHLLIPMLIALVLYGVILMASGLLLQSVSDEKKNRVMEILLLSVNPLQMLTGKIIALGIAGLLQAVVWGGMGYLFFALTGRIFSLPAGIELLPSLLVWGAVFFLLGYVMYASLMAGAGALVPDIKEFRMVSLMISAPALVGFEIGLLTTDNPHGALATGASLFPLTAPFIIIKRLVVGGVPLWQLLMASGLLVVTSFFIVRAVARMFHAQNLLSGQRFSVKRYFRALLGRT